MKKICKSCKSEIDSKATKCLHCGADQRGWFRRHPVWSVILGLIVLGMIGSAIGNKGSSNQVAGSTQQTGQTETKPSPTAQTPIIVDATTLVGEYDKNKLAANEKYNGKLVQTSGYISNISGGDLGGDYYLILKPNNNQYYFGTEIQAFFKDKSVLTSLSNGQKITVQGTMGDMTLGSVVMNDSSVVR